MSTTIEDIDETGSEIDAKNRILAVTQELIAMRGPERMTIREIAKLSQTNIAAVNYHFGSKRALVEKVLYRIFKPVNAQRETLLRRATERYKPEPVPLADIFDAMNRPVVESARAADGGSYYLRTLLHLRAFPNDYPNVFVQSTFDATAQVFVDRLHAALPMFSRAEIIWRYEMVRGAMIHTLTNCDPISGKFRYLSKSEDESIDLSDREALLLRLKNFMIASLVAD